MRLFKLHLEENPFWFLGNKIKLNKNNPDSDFFDLNSFTENELLIIEASLNKRILVGYDLEGNEFLSFKSLNLEIGEFSIDINDIDYEEEEPIPVISVTDYIEETPIKISEQDYEEAELFLNKHVKTVAKSIKEIIVSDTNISFLMACLEKEQYNKNRNSVVTILKEKINGYTTNC